VRELALGLGQLEVAVVEDRRQGRSHLDSGESGPEALVRASTPGREDVGPPVLVPRRAIAVDVETLRLREVLGIEVAGRREDHHRLPAIDPESLEREVACRVPWHREGDGVHAQRLVHRSVQVIGLSEHAGVQSPRLEESVRLVAHALEQLRMAEQLVEDEDVGLTHRVDTGEERKQPRGDQLVVGEEIGVLARCEMHGVDEVR
jgi:hypothetical protein